MIYGICFIGRQIKSEPALKHGHLKTGFQAPGPFRQQVGVILYRIDRDQGIATEWRHGLVGIEYFPGRGVVAYLRIVDPQLTQLQPGSIEQVIEQEAT